MTPSRAVALAILCASLSACDPAGASDDGSELDGGDDASGDDASGDDAGTSPDLPVQDPDGDVFLRNRVALNMEVTLRPLRAEDAPDCDTIAADPAALPPDAFDEGRVETLTPHQVTVVWPHEPGERECYAARVESDGLGARILFWWDGDPAPAPAPTDCCSDGPGILQLIPTPDGWSLHLTGDTRLVFDPRAE